MPTSPALRVFDDPSSFESIEVQARITEGGILIGYWDEDDLAEARKHFKPRFASTNPLVRPTLNRLTHPETTGDAP